MSQEQLNKIGAAKLIIGDVKPNQAYYEQMFGMKEVDAKHPIEKLDPAKSGAFKIAIARDPSGNAIELISRPGKWQVGGAKLIVDDRQKAEQFYAAVFGAAPGQRFKTSTYDEVLMSLGGGPFLALFQPLAEPPLPKSKYPLVAIYSQEFDAVLKRVTDAGWPKTPRAMP